MVGEEELEGGQKYGEWVGACFGMVAEEVKVGGFKICFAGRVYWTS